jgi:hypothetical protein
MKNIKHFFTKTKSIIWILLVPACYLVITLALGCKDEPIAPEKGLAISTRDEEHLELLGVSCFPDSLLELCDSIPTIDSMAVTLADYPGCTFWLTFEYYYCRNDSIDFYHIGNFQIISHDCSAFSTAFNTAYAAGGPTLAAFVENFDHDVFLEIKKNLAEELIPPGTHPCNGGSAYFRSYMRASCYKWCYIEDGHTVSSTRVACGSDCCVERTRACRDETGKLVLESTIDPSYPPNCDGPTIFGTGQLPGLCTSESACTYSCQE